MHNKIDKFCHDYLNYVLTLQYNCKYEKIVGCISFLMAQQLSA